MEVRIKSPGFLEIQTPHGVATGGSQIWYTDKWQRASGCGPTAASNIIWYLSRSRPGMERLWDADDRSRESFLRLMTEMFEYITPGRGGVNSSRIFTEGIAAFGEAHGVSLAPRSLDIPQLGRPREEEMRDFILEGLRGDCPVAFLNLSNGNQQQLDHWHWVTIIGLDEKMSAKISDQGQRLDVNLKEWLNTSLLGGAFVFLT